MLDKKCDCVCELREQEEESCKMKGKGYKLPVITEEVFKHVRITGFRSFKSKGKENS